MLYDLKSSWVNAQVIAQMTSSPDMQKALLDMLEDIQNLKLLVDSKQDKTTP